MSCRYVKSREDALGRRWRSGRRRHGLALLLSMRRYQMCQSRICLRAAQRGATDMPLTSSWYLVVTRATESASGTFPTTSRSQTISWNLREGVRSMRFFDHVRAARVLVAVLACNVASVHAQAVRQAAQQAAPVPAAVAIPRPTAAEVELVRESFEEFLASTDA